jgi:transposase
MAAVGECPNCAGLRKEIAVLRTELDELRRVVRDLRARLNLNSQNSSRPPSSDLPSAPPRPKAPPSGRKPGGQPGHEGTTRQPFSFEQVDRHIPVRPPRCGRCSKALSADAAAAGEPRRQQVVEVPPGAAIVTEYVLENVRCPGCGATTQAEPPAEVDGVVGPRLQAVLAVLTGRFRLSKREAEELVEALYGEKARVSLGLVSDLEARTSEALAPAHAEAHAAVQKAPVAHADETSFPQRHKKGWLWTLCTESVAFYLHHEERSKKAAQELLGDFAGALVVDRWVSYRHYLLCQLCLAHLKRNFQELVDRGGPGASVGRAGLRALAAVFDLLDRFEKGEVTFESLARKVRPVRDTLFNVLYRGRSNADPKAAAISKDLIALWPAVWTFTRIRGVPPTNNLAERRLRPAVLWRKGSFGTASARGSRFLERILTVVQTLRLRGRSILEFIESAILAMRLGHEPPPLLSG